MSGKLVPYVIVTLNIVFIIVIFFLNLSAVFGERHFVHSDWLFGAGVYYWFGCGIVCSVRPVC